MTNMELLEAAEKKRRTGGISQLEFGELKQVVKDNKTTSKNADLKIKDLESQLKVISESLAALVKSCDEKKLKESKKPKKLKEEKSDSKEVKEVKPKED